MILQTTRIRDNTMTREQALKAFQIASLTFPAMAMEIRDPPKRLADALARAEEALAAAYRAVDELYFPKDDV